MSRIFSKIKYLLVFCICLGMIVPTYAITINQTSPANIIRPYTFGFGSQGDSDEGVEELVKAGNFKHLMFTDSTGYSIPYWVHIPTDDKGNPIENLPLVMYMHGYSDGGNNEIAIRYHNAVVFRLIQEQDNPDRQAIILVPQTPNATNGLNEIDYFKDQWVGIKGDDKWSQWNIEQWNMDETPRTNNLNAVVELVEAVQQQTKSDINRAYVTGISMGGCATWDLISRDNENIFAAAVPICGIGDPSKAKNAQNIPIKMYHGLKDTTIDHISSLKMYSSLRKYGNVSLVEYNQEGHPCWNAAYSPILDDDNDGVSNIDDLINWMFNQSKNGTLDGKVDKDPLISVLYDAKQEKEINYLPTQWNELQEIIKKAEILLNNECTDSELKEIIKKLDEIISDKKTSYIGMWNLDEGKGNTITDTEGKYTGTLQGDVSWIDG
ncbi:dienelactone hydrolase family protein, partial [Thomasclavelia spiroformis]|uniref:carboxylesterase family protein n=1 Tax=Thomasclavelia spiroformis TaxID=29348 RepID=UPI00241FFEA3